MGINVKPGFTAADLEEFVRLKLEKADLDRQVAAKESRLKQLGDQCRAYLTALGKRSCRKFGYLLALIDGRTSVKWKEEFIRVAGEAEATAVAAAAPKSQTLVIEPVPQPAADPVEAK